MGVLPGMTASQATVLVMGGRNVAAKVQGKEGYGMDWETRRLTEMTDEELLEMRFQKQRVVSRVHKPNRIWKSLLFYLLSTLQLPSWFSDFFTSSAGPVLVQRWR